MTVSWPADLDYPILVDPQWQTTDTMAAQRAAHHAALLSTGDALIVGGFTLTAPSFANATCELYDPATGMFAATDSLEFGRYDFTLTELSNGHQLAAGGSGVGGLLSSSETYDPATGLWTTRGSFINARSRHSAAPISTGRVLVTGGCTASGCTNEVLGSRIYREALGTWINGANMSTPRKLHTSTWLPAQSKVLVVGGQSPAATGTAELYTPDASTGTWSSAGSWTARYSHQATLLPNGDVIVTGGIGTSSTLQSAARYTPGVGWSGAGLLSAQRSSHTATLLDYDGRLLLTGGCNGSSNTSGAEIYDPVAELSMNTDPMDVRRMLHAAVSLPNGDVLVTGGPGASSCGYGNSNGAELFQRRPDGESCTVADQCGSGFCVDGVCCDSACGGTCRSCTKELKGTGKDGECGDTAQGTDPGGDCPDDGAASCDRNGSCDGTGQCELYAAGTVCGASTCSSGQQTGFSCDGFGTCDSATVSCAPYVCADPSQCATTCSSHSDCIASSHCSSLNTCIPDKGNGSLCSAPDECISGNCVDGVCCDQPCGGTCEACTQALKGPGTSDGVCEPVAGGTDPDNDCPRRLPGLVPAKRAVRRIGSVRAVRQRHGVRLDHLLRWNPDRVRVRRLRHMLSGRDDRLRSLPLPGGRLRHDLREPRRLRARSLLRYGQHLQARPGRLPALRLGGRVRERQLRRRGLLRRAVHGHLPGL